MEKFNLKTYLANPSRKVMTRDGKSVRILCTDAMGDYPVVGLICYHDERDVPENFTENGSYYIGDESSYDLFFAPIKGEGWVNVYKMPDTDGFEASCIFKTKEEARIFRGANYVATTKITWEE